MRLLFATAEVSPVARTGGLGDVCGSLPKALAKLGHEVIVCLPYYRQAREYFASAGVAPEVIASEVLTWGNWIAGLIILRATLPHSEVPLLLIANDYFFDRDALYAPDHAGRDDGIERYAFFCRGVIRACEIVDFRPDVVHAHDWHTAPLALYLDSGLRESPQFSGSGSVYTIHNLNYQGIAAPSQFAALGLHSRYWRLDALEHFGQLNLMKGGILFADQITTVSPTYATEIRTPEFGAGLDGILRQLSPKLTGILNGIDVDVWNPALDTYLPAHFESGNLAGKAASKETVTNEAGLKSGARKPLLGIVSRLVDQKGFDLLLPVLPRLLRAGAQAIILGSGESALEEGFIRIGTEAPKDCRVWTRFDEGLAHRIIGGADLLLMPSRYEPCGLNQMYALRYGTLPVVRLTGGLADTVVPYDGTNREKANGFGFPSADSAELFMTTWIGMLNYRDMRVWRTLQANGMAIDFSWERSARQYEEIYDRVGRP